MSCEPRAPMVYRTYKRGGCTLLRHHQRFRDSLTVGLHARNASSNGRIQDHGIATSLASCNGLVRNSVAYAPSVLLLVFAAIVVLDIVGNTAVLTDSMAALTAPK